MELHGLEKVINVLQEEIEKYDNAADSYPFNDEAYLRMEGHLDKLEKLLQYALSLKE